MNWDSDAIAPIFCYVILLAPLFAFLVTAAIAVFEAPVNERMTNHLTEASILAGMAGGAGMLTLLVLSGQRGVAVELGNWVNLPEYHFQFSFKFLFDRLSMAFLFLALILSGVVGAFVRVYLHREPGYRRFYLLFTMFVFGMSVCSIAGTIETLFAGWEIVGLSSALLVGFFQERPAPVRSALRVWTIYRIADAAFLVAAVAFHHVATAGDFVRLTGGDVWPEGLAPVDPRDALVVGSLLLIAAAGKSGLLPFSGWLPRAMEGPTPSSAIFYGALSIHLGAFLLLRVGALISLSPLLCALMVALGLATAVWATLTSRTQADVKNVLAFASLTQVGLIVAEIGLGFRMVALVHLVGNASLRTLQFLRAPSLLHDFHQIEAAIGRHATSPERTPGFGPQRILYRLGFERALFDNLLENYLVGPFRWVMNRVESLEERWIACLGRSVAETRFEPTPRTRRME